MVRISFLFLMFSVLIGCKKVPPEFYRSMEVQNNGVGMMAERYKVAVEELVENWYLVQVEMIELGTKCELVNIQKVSSEGMVFYDPVEMGMVQGQYLADMAEVEEMRLEMLEGYSDEVNWDRLRRLSELNLEFAHRLDVGWDEADVGAFMSIFTANQLNVWDKFGKRK